MCDRFAGDGAFAGIGGGNLNTGGGETGGGARVVDRK
jgi:hypothetical protein